MPWPGPFMKTLCTRAHASTLAAVLYTPTALAGCAEAPGWRAKSRRSRTTIQLASRGLDDRQPSNSPPPRPPRHPD